MEIEEATIWDHPAVLSILLFKVPVLLLLLLVSRVYCRLTAKGLENLVLGRWVETDLLHAVMS